MGKQAGAQAARPDHPGLAHPRPRTAGKAKATTTTGTPKMTARPGWMPTSPDWSTKRRR
jgi:hypothetical protein